MNKGKRFWLSTVAVIAAISIALVLIPKLVKQREFTTYRQISFASLNHPDFLPLEKVYIRGKVVTFTQLNGSIGRRTPPLHLLGPYIERFTIVAEEIGSKQDLTFINKVDVNWETGALPVNLKIGDTVTVYGFVGGQVSGGHLENGKMVEYTTITIDAKYVESAP